jgi:hypothetical protein
LLDVHSNLPHDTYGGSIVIFGGGDNTPKVQVLEGVLN